MGSKENLELDEDLDLDTNLDLDDDTDLDSNLDLDEDGLWGYCYSVYIKTCKNDLFCHGKP